jgi:hypothetical protein
VGQSVRLVFLQLLLSPGAENIGQMTSRIYCVAYGSLDDPMPKLAEYIWANLASIGFMSAEGSVRREFEG